MLMTRKMPGWELTEVGRSEELTGFTTDVVDPPAS